MYRADDGYLIPSSARILFILFLRHWNSPARYCSKWDELAHRSLSSNSQLTLISVSCYPQISLWWNYLSYFLKIHQNYHTHTHTHTVPLFRHDDWLFRAGPVVDQSLCFILPPTLWETQSHLLCPTRQWGIYHVTTFPSSTNTEFDHHLQWLQSNIPSVCIDCPFLFQNRLILTSESSCRWDCHSQAGFRQLWAETV